MQNRKVAKKNFAPKKLCDFARLMDLKKMTSMVSIIVELYRRRWDLEMFYKLIKQNLQIKTFIGTSVNNSIKIFKIDRLLTF